jgi:hypothetical protein
MEMEQCEAKVVMKRRRTILDKVIFLEKGIKILDFERFMWTQMKQNYDKHEKWMENWKDIVVEEDWASKVGLVPLFLMGWEASMADVMLEIFNTFFIEDTNFYFGHKDNQQTTNYRCFWNVWKGM